MVWEVTVAEVGIKVGLGFLSAIETTKLLIPQLN